MTMTNIFKTSIATLAILAGTTLLAAHAQVPTDGELGFQAAATPLAEEVHRFHNVVLLPIITFISLFVLGLLIWVILRYNRRANPVARKFSHNTTVEVLWTLIPIFILAYIAVFSFDLLYKEDVLPDGQKVSYVSDGTSTAYAFENDFQQDRMVTQSRHMEVYVTSPAGERTRLASDAYSLEGLGTPEVLVSLESAPAAGSEITVVGGRSRIGRGKFLDLFGEDNSEIATRPTLTIKATGYQWGWNYAYPDYGDFEFDALLAQKDDLEDSSLYLLAATNDIVVPAGETVRIITTARDVIHSWAMPAFTLKIDAVPGRLNETWFRAPSTPGTTYYGQCSEICGKDHAYMPIGLRVVSDAEFEAWVDEQRALAGMDPYFDNETRLADAADSSDAAQ
ncbi:cytochrome c oxidase subunit II [Parvularcula flava]|uniref:Cytochrome c oxidase subunit 2 n=2 Tax=Aquisalinus luteolus TaxID=1566827 RepID=A0ABX0HI13_9PROT|nr:cytochrome c oxidase subunit II [Aquisalinus luteolus]NHK26558.1 cytochrome c oxidase subunit II [Aquisalinus luteolus]